MATNGDRNLAIDSVPTPKRLPRASGAADRQVSSWVKMVAARCIPPPSSTG